MPTLIKENSSNSALVMDLVGVLKEEASLFETFLELLEDQQRALVSHDLATINDITMMQNKMIMEGAKLTAKREAVTEQITMVNGWEENMIISSLIESVSQEKAVQLEALRDDLLDLHTKIGKIRSQNEMLVNRSRENIDKTLELIGNIKAPDGRYHKEGKLNKATASLALDRRA